MAKTRKRKESLLVRNLTSSSVLWPPIFNWNVVRVTTKIVEPWNDSNFCTLFFLLTRPLSYWLRKPKCNFQQHQKMWAGQLKEVGEWSLSGAHHQEPATTPYSCHGVFTDRSTFSLIYFEWNLSDQLQSQARTNFDMSTWCRHVHARLHCFIPTETCSRRLELAYTYLLT